MTEQLTHTHTCSDRISRESNLTWDLEKKENQEWEKLARGATRDKGPLGGNVLHIYELKGEQLGCNKSD